MIDVLFDDLTSAFLIFCRVGACFMLLPGLSSMRVPVQVRLYAALSVSAALAGFLSTPVNGIETNADLLLAILSELLIGAFFGLIVRFYIAALDFIVSGVAMSIGFGGMLGTPVEGQEAQSSLTSLVSFSALFILFVLDFHHLVFRALVNTYEVQPTYVLPNLRMMLVSLTDVLYESFLIALQLGSPFIGFAIIANLGVGFINKLAPQIPIYFIALPFMLAGALLILYFAIPHFLKIFGQAFPVILQLGLK